VLVVAPVVDAKKWKRLCAGSIALARRTFSEVVNLGTPPESLWCVNWYLQTNKACGWMKATYNDAFTFTLTLYSGVFSI